MSSIALARADLRLSRTGVVALFAAVALAMLPLADLSITSRDPWSELGRLAGGLLAPDPTAIESIAAAVTLTLAFAIAAVATGGALGLALAPFYGFRPVRAFCVAVRSVHELFWALLFMQVYGISVVTGVLAIALPYTGIFAKVFSEYLDEADPRPQQVLAAGTGALAAFLYARLPLAAAEIRTYTLYRLECGIRSSAVLGFIGLPTLGFQLDTYFKQGEYGAVGAILIVYFTIIASIRWWMRWRFAPAYVAAALVALAFVASPPLGASSLWRFLTVDIVPQPMRDASLLDPSTWASLGAWGWSLLSTQGLPGAAATLIVAQLALILSGLIAILSFPLIVPRVVGRAASLFGHLGLVAGRSSPEYMLAYIFLQILGPSMLPAVLALALHNGAIIAHLLGRQGDELSGRLRPDAPRGLDLYGYELVPRLYGSFLALCLYRWEIIIRESAIVGMLGIATLGFYIDSAVSELRLDRVVALLLVTIAVTALVDALSRRLRRTIGAAGLSIFAGPCS